MTHVVRIYRTTFTEEAIVDGGYGDADTDEEEHILEPEEEETAVDLAAELITSNGLTCPSSWPWQPGDWWTDPDGSQVSNYRTGEREEASAHLEGFSVEEETAVYALVSA